MKIPSSLADKVAYFIEVSFVFVYIEFVACVQKKFFSFVGLEALVPMRNCAETAEGSEGFYLWFGG